MNVASVRVAPDVRALENGAVLSISPGGTLVFSPNAVATDVDTVLDEALQERLQDSLAIGSGAFLLALSAEPEATQFPASLAYFRAFGREFVASACKCSDLSLKEDEVAPPADLSTRASALPPLPGAEYFDETMLVELWRAMELRFKAEWKEQGGSLERFLARFSGAWHMVGRVCFHLAENKRTPETPFAFLATYTNKLSADDRPKHLPLARALEEFSGAQNKPALLSLLKPVQRAAESSPLLKRLVDSGDLFHPLAWTPEEAHAFLRQIPSFEAAGVVVRVPDWWRARRRLQVSVSIGQKTPSGLGMDTLLDFSAAVSLDGEVLSDDEWRQISQSSSGLGLIKGKWVEIDKDKLAHVLDHWKQVEKENARGGLSFIEGMRLLSRAPLDDGTDADAIASEWTRVEPGPWLEKTLAELKSPNAGLDLSDLRATLRPYQESGVRWLHTLCRLGLGGCLADDMGLGKTVQVLGLIVALKAEAAKRKLSARPSRVEEKAARHLLVLPASLLGNWQAEIARFAPSLSVFIAHPSFAPFADLENPDEARLANIDLVITTYGALSRFAWLGSTPWDLVVLDEAQAIKNPNTKQTRAAKALKGRVRVVLTGTPIENRLADLWSLFDFLAPGLLGAPKAFTQFSKRLEEKGDYGPLRQLVRPYILRRLKTDKRIISDLPDKTELRALCPLSKVQAVLYQDAVTALARDLDAKDGIERRGTILAFLLRFKQICNHPSQWLGDGNYMPEASGKFARLGELVETIALRQEKVLVFTQFREMTGPLSRFLAAIFAREGLVLHGETPVKERKRLVDAFQAEQGPPFFVLSLKAGGVGLNLTAASHVIHFDRWWNPAVENQATDRAFRIGQKKNVLVHKFVCRGTIEEQIDKLIEHKKALSGELFEGSEEVKLTEMTNDELLKLVRLDLATAMAEG